MEAEMKTKIAVLYYHRVYVKQNDTNLLCVEPKKFEQQMKYLKKNYNILRFEEDWSKSDRDGIVITFDDGMNCRYPQRYLLVQEYCRGVGNCGGTNWKRYC